ncbi:MAG: hypothetical protein ACOX4C_00810 [Bacillota bacterium]
MPLSGSWKFHWSSAPGERPVGFVGLGYDVSGWDDIEVAGNWQYAGYDHPVYPDVKYTFDNSPLTYNPISNLSDHTEKSLSSLAAGRRTRSSYISPE